MTYVAFLRGINVGGHKLIKMTELKEIIGSLGLKNVRTYIQSGNVIFDAPANSEAALIKKMESGLIKCLGYEVRVILRDKDQLSEMISHDPFKGQPLQSKYYVTLLPTEPTQNLALPLISEKDHSEILSISSREVYSVSHEAPNGGYGKLDMLEKLFGKHSTTRNWNTILKIIQLIPSKIRT